MSARTDRLEATRRVIEENQVGNQEDVLSLLKAKGFRVTQATLSRDFKELGVVKVHDSSRGGYVYQLSAQTPKFIVPNASHLTSDGIKSIEFSNSLAVIKTHPGFASAVAYIIDNNVIREIIGTLAGDDTVLLIVREGCSREQVIEAISHFISGIQTKLI